MLLLFSHNASFAQDDPAIGNPCIEFTMSVVSTAIPSPFAESWITTNNELNLCQGFEAIFSLDFGTSGCIPPNFTIYEYGYMVMRSSNLSASLPTGSNSPLLNQPILPHNSDWTTVGVYPITVNPTSVISVNHSNVMQYRSFYVARPFNTSNWFLLPHETGHSSISLPIFVRAGNPTIVNTPLSVCYGDPLTLTAPAGLTNINWSATPTFGGLGPASITTQSITFTPFSLGYNLYTYTALDANGCVVSGSWVVTTISNAVPAQIVGNTTRCEENYDYSISNPISGASYGWSVPGGTVSNATGLNTSITSLPGGGTFNIIVATTIGSCVRFDTLIIGECCAINPDILVWTNTDLETVAQGATNLSNFNVSVNGVFTLNVDNFTFNNVTFELGPNAKMIDNTGLLTNFDNCTFRPCSEEMWDGIYTTGLDNEITLKHCRMEGAINGLVSTNAARLNVNGSTFTDNHIAIQIKNSNPVSVPNIGTGQRFVIEGNTFTTQQFMDQQYTNNLGPFAYIYSFLSTDVIIGRNGAGNINDFGTLYRPLHYGIYGKISSIEVNNANFEYYGSLGDANTYCGIYSSSVGKTSPFHTLKTDLYVAFANSTASFRNLHTGIWSHSNDVTFIHSSTFNYVSNVGVRVTNAKNTASVKFCQMETASNNYVGQYGILMENANIIQGGATIFSNVIRQKRWGIFFANINGASIQNNVLSYTDQVLPSGPTQVGIYSKASQNLVVLDNTITRTVQPDLSNLLFNGVSLEGGLNNTIRANTITNMSGGIGSVGLLTGTRYMCNTYNSLIHGMAFYNTFLTNQGTPDFTFDNIWNNNRTTTKINGSNNTGNVIQWFHKASASYNISGIAVQNNSLQNQLNATLANIDAGTDCEALEPPGPGHDEELMGMIISGQTNQNNVELQKDDFHFAYRKLDLDTVLRNSNGVFQQFYIAKSTQNEGLFQEIAILAESDQVLDAIIQLDNYQPSSTRENIMKQATAYYLNSWQSGKVLDSTQRAELTTIANLDPLEFGDGVVVAQVLLGDYPEPVQNAFRNQNSNIEVPVKAWTPDVFPNPAQSYLNVTGVEGDVDYVITNLQGKLMQQGTLSEGNSITVNSLSSGMYLLKLIQGTNTSTLKIVKN